MIDAFGVWRSAFGVWRERHTLRGNHGSENQLMCTLTSNSETERAMQRGTRQTPNPKNQTQNGYR
jgi:hypothetical protein